MLVHSLSHHRSLIASVGVFLVGATAIVLSVSCEPVDSQDESASHPPLAILKSAVKRELTNGASTSQIRQVGFHPFEDLPTGRSRRNRQPAQVGGDQNPRPQQDVPQQRTSSDDGGTGINSAGTLVEAFPMPATMIGVDLTKQTPAAAMSKSTGCIACHQTVKDPHFSDSVQLGCTDCHGGDPNATVKERAHVLPQIPGAWPKSANPVRSYTLLNHESPDFVRFVNPGDLRVAHISCGQCHGSQTLQVKKSMMTHGCMLWGAALYNNGSVPNKWSRYGESYSMDGIPQRLQTVPAPTAYEMAQKGILPYLDPLPRFQLTHPGNILRVFERGGRFRLETGIPEPKEEPGRPRSRLSNRGLGTLNRSDPTFLGLEKTRLLDPTLNFMGTNDHPGDYRSSGCTACHVVYANDRSPVHSGPFAKYGHLGMAASQPDAWVRSVDPTIPKNEPGHPIQHRFTTAIPTSQCIVCHIHPGTNVLNSYLGYMWWDQETDGELMYPRHERKPTAEEYSQSTMSDPNETSIRGLWSNPEFLNNVAELNPKLEHTQFADFNGHGWVFRAVFKKDRKGNLLDHHGEVLVEVDAQKRQMGLLIPQYVKQLYQDRDWGYEDPAFAASVRQKEAELETLRHQVPVHMLDIHLEKGMHCVDCHFVQDVHGDSKLYGEVRAAIEITCRDCHGDINRRAAVIEDGRPEMRTSGPAAKGPGLNLLGLRTPSGKRRFEVRGDRIVQNSMVEKNLSWEISQVADTIDPTKPEYNAKAALAKTVRFGPNGQNYIWGDRPDSDSCAHSPKSVSCIACHSAWNQSCYGCHLSQKANRKTPNLHFEGDVTRNAVSYNFQTLRDEVYMLARDGNVTGNRVGPSRSSCAIHVGSYNANRESIYVQQQTISAEGLSGIAFSTNVPHTVRGKEDTKNCSDCHVAASDDNNALLAQLQMHGTNYLNLIGRYCWVAAGEEGLFGVAVTEQQEPQAVIGSYLHQLAFPKHYEEHRQLGQELKEAHEHPGIDVGEKLRHPRRQHEVLSAQLRGEYLYAACGESGIRVYDVANIDNKAFSERIVTAPFSPIGQKFYVESKHATDVVAPTTMAPDPTRTHRPENHEPTISMIYAYIYATDLEEGLIMINVATLLDGDPTNNFLKKDIVFNPENVLHGAKSVTIVGNYAYVCCDKGLVVISLVDPANPQITSIIGEQFIKHPTQVQVQFRYAFACDQEGVKILDITDLSQPRPVAHVPMNEAHKIYVARTYAYVAAGHDGLVILDVENPERPRVDQVFTANGQINDLRDVKLGISYVSQFAYLADGKNGMRIVQLTSPRTQGNDGFSPQPTPELIATYKVPHGGEAVSISEGVDRDRAVDESGNQIAVFGRVGARPFNQQEMQKLYLRPNGQLFKVIDGKRNYQLPEAIRERTLYEELRAFYR